MSRFPDSPDSPSKTAHFNSLRPRVCSDYFSLEDILVFWRSGAYKKYPRSYGADHRVCGDHCPTSGHSGPRTPVNDLKSFGFLTRGSRRKKTRGCARGVRHALAAPSPTRPRPPTHPNLRHGRRSEGMGAAPRPRPDGAPRGRPERRVSPRRLGGTPRPPS